MTELDNAELWARLEKLAVGSPASPAPSVLSTIALATLGLMDHLGLLQDSLDNITEALGDIAEAMKVELGPEYVGHSEDPVVLVETCIHQVPLEGVCPACEAELMCPIHGLDMDPSCEACPQL